MVRLHVGAHKTASTYIQETLLLNRAESAAAGTAFWPLHSARRALSAAREAASSKDRTRWAIPWNKTSKSPNLNASPLEDLFPEGFDVTISEENILGNPDDCYKGVFYRRASEGLKLFAEALEERPVEVLLSVRSYAPFLASIYAESLRHGMFTTPEKMMASNSSCEGQWLQVVDAVLTALPHAKIVMWRYEDFPKLEGAILSRLSGLPAERIKKPSQTDILPSASKQAIEAMIEQAGPLARNQRIFRMLALNAQYPRRSSNEDRFMPFSQEDQNRLQREYETDLAKIEARDDVTLLAC